MHGVVKHFRYYYIILIKLLKLSKCNKLFLLAETFSHLLKKIHQCFSDKRLDRKAISDLVLCTTSGALKIRTQD